jgi:hypothetical protein
MGLFAIPANNWSNTIRTEFKNQGTGLKRVMQLEFY